MDEFGGEPGERLNLPEWKQMRFFAAETFIADEAYPEYIRRTFVARLGNERPDLYKVFMSQVEAQEKKKEKEKAAAEATENTQQGAGTLE